MMINCEFKARLIVSPSPKRLTLKCCIFGWDTRAWISVLKLVFLMPIVAIDGLLSLTKRHVLYQHLSGSRLIQISVTIIMRLAVVTHVRGAVVVLLGGTRLCFLKRCQVLHTWS
jgi:hypothetical protein